MLCSHVVGIEDVESVWGCAITWISGLASDVVTVEALNGYRCSGSPLDPEAALMTMSMVECGKLPA